MADTNALERFEARPPAGAVDRLGQATAVEQSRAVAEVQASVIVAQQYPRDTQAALQQMRDSCRNMRLAERAFFRFPRGGQTLTGPTVHLARELARVWGNIQYGINELSRDDNHAQSDMMAWAWDIQTNTRSAQVFIVPHMRDKKGGPERLTDMRDIYENNTNQASRRLRQAIWSILPPWLIDEAEEICNATLKDGGGVPLPQRIANSVAAFERLGVSSARIEQKFSKKAAQWTEFDVAQLGVTYKSIERGEVTVEDEFPVERIKAADITGAPPAQPAAPAPAAPAAWSEPPADDPSPSAAPSVEEPPEVDGWPEVTKPGGK